jgi:hypothetical protein
MDIIMCMYFCVRTILPAVVRSETAIASKQTRIEQFENLLLKHTT